MDWPKTSVGVTAAPALAALERMFDTRVMGLDTMELGAVHVVRVAVVWCPDWPVVAHRRTDQAAVVVHANRVVAASPLARAQGVVGGLRRREAQSRCPGVEVLERDLDLEARMFEAVVGCLDDLTPRTEILRPGLLAFPTRGPSRYFGGDQAMAERCRAVVMGSDPVLGPAGAGAASPVAPPRLGIADSVFAATIAARTRPNPGSDSAGTEVAGGDTGVTIVAPGETAAFLAPVPSACSTGPTSSTSASGWVSTHWVRTPRSTRSTSPVVSAPTAPRPTGSHAASTFAPRR